MEKMQICFFVPFQKIEKRPDIKMINISAPHPFWHNIQLDNFFREGYADPHKNFLTSN